MQRPGKMKQLEEPLLPKWSETSKNDGAPRSQGNTLPKTILAILYRCFVLTTCWSSINQFVSDETVFLVPGEYIVLIFTVVTWLRTAVATGGSIEAGGAWDFYLVLLLYLRFVLPIWSAYYSLAVMLLFQSARLGIDARVLLRAEEEINRKKVDEKDIGIGPTTHLGVGCDDCGVCPMVGIRYKAKEKPDYDVCEPCMAKKPRTERNTFTAIHVPVPLGHETVARLRADEKRILKQRKMQKESEAREALFLASIDSKQASVLDVV